MNQDLLRKPKIRTRRILCEELRGLIAELSRCRPSRIMPTSKLREHLGIDSFTGLEILVALEQRYGLKISEAEANCLTTFQDLVVLLERRLRT